MSERRGRAREHEDVLVALGRWQIWNWSVSRTSISMWSSLECKISE